MNDLPVALVTGANRGIGHEIVRQLAQKGFRVFLGSRSLTRGLDAARKMEDLPGKVEAIALDVADPESIRSAVGTLVGKTDRLNVLVNNAGILEDEGRSILDLSRDDLFQTLRTNTFGPLDLARAVWPMLKKGKPGRIINLSSGLGQLADMENETPAYAISKTALNAITRQLAAAGKSDGVLVNSNCPGWVRTEMGGENASRSVEQGADTAVWLATGAPETVTGQFLRDREVIPW